MCVCVSVFVSPIMVYIGSCRRPDTAAINRKLGTIFQAAAHVYPSKQTEDIVLNDSRKWKWEEENASYNVATRQTQF